MFDDIFIRGIVIAIILVIAVIVIPVIIILAILDDTRPRKRGGFSSLFSGYVSPEKQAGRRGEKIVTTLIAETLEEGDVLLTNVHIVWDDKETELDNVVVNNCGVFIIEAKNYSGDLIGDEDDYEWVKNKITSAGNLYQKTVPNPIHQVKRQIFILASYLRSTGINLWVEGYVFFVEQNSPVDSEHVLDTRADINRVLHHGRNNKLSEQNKERIVRLLETKDDIE